MKNLMMVGRIIENGELKKFRVVDVVSKEVLDLSKQEIAKSLNEGEIKIPNLKLDSNGDVICPHDINKYGIVGQSNAFVVIIKKIIDAANIDGISFEISDVNGLVKNYFQSDAVNLNGFYRFANVHVDTINNQIKAMSNSGVYISEGLDQDERKVKAISFVKELQRSNINVALHKLPYKHESPNSFTIKALGRIGGIKTAPGTESFNKKILEALRFNNAVADGTCKFIQPTYGYTERYTGWKTSSEQATELPNNEFTISPISCYGDDFLNDNNYSKSDYLYCVNLKFLNTYVYVLKNSKIGQVRVLKQQ